MTPPLGIADTSFIVAFLHANDRHHAWAVEQFKRYPFLVTCEPVITEAAHLAGRYLGRPHLPLDLVHSGALRLTYPMVGDEPHLVRLLKKYADVPMDLADACLVRMTEQHTRCEVVNPGPRLFRLPTPRHTAHPDDHALSAQPPPTPTTPKSSTRRCQAVPCW